MLTAVRRIFGRIIHSQTALHSQWDKHWKNNSRFASPSIRRPTVLAAMMNMIWIVGVNQTEMPFYTSDTAAIRKGYEGVSGFACKGLEITFPITPKLVLILREPEYFHKDAHLHNRFFRLSQSQVEYINELQVTRSYRYTFCIEDNFSLAKNLIRKYPDLQKIDYDRVSTTL